MKPSSLESALRRIIRRGRVLTAPAQLAGYDADGLGHRSFRPDAVVLPADADELADLMRAAPALDAPLCFRGAGTSLSGGPVAAQGGVVAHLSAMRRVRHVDAAGMWCEAECGVNLSRLDEALKPHGLFYPPDPSSGPVCTLGGNVAMNAGGAHCFRHGVTSNYVLGLEAILLDGVIARFGGPAGGRGPWREDWTRLMVGSEGTLAAFTRFWLRLAPRADKAWTFRAAFADLEAAERAIHALVAHAAYPTAIELMDPRCVAMVENSPMAVGLPRGAFLLVTEIDGPAALADARVGAVAALLREAGATRVDQSDDELQRQKLWKARKVAGGLMGQLSRDILVQDAVIPKRELAGLLRLIYDEADAAGVPVVNVFHAGDGNLHPNFLFDSRRPGELEKVEHLSKRLMQRVVAVGGTLSGEHGIGNDKAAYMPLVFDAAATRLQLAVPQAFNPRHQLNPLKVFTSRRFGGVPGDSNGSVSNGEASALARAPLEPTNGAARIFSPLIDPVDGVACLAADASAADARALAQAHGLRFPLWLDGEATLAAHLAASGFAPASTRFGAYRDNIVGMNWRLPGGTIVRFGERVVKSTTGYDLHRFLLATRGAFGTPTAFVLRLRPDCGWTGVVALRGEEYALDRAAANLRRSCWSHWCDAIDCVVETEAESDAYLRVVVHCPPHEWPLFETWSRGFASERGLAAQVAAPAPTPLDGLPDFALKTTPDRAIAAARDLVRRGAARCVALCACGVVHGYLAAPDAACETRAAARVAELLAPLEPALREIGGDWRSWRVPPPEPEPLEAEWLAVLAREFAAS